MDISNFVYTKEEKEEYEEAVYYCKQCGWFGKSSKLIVDNGWYEDYPPFFCPNCMADEYDLYDLEEGDLELTFWDKLKIFCRKISFYGFRRRWGCTHPPLKYLICNFFKYYDIKMYFRNLIKTKE